MYLIGLDWMKGSDDHYPQLPGCGCFWGASPCDLVTRSRLGISRFRGV